jgi:hypothetical protein
MTADNTGNQSLTPGPLWPTGEIHLSRTVAMDLNRTMPLSPPTPTIEAHAAVDIGGSTSTHNFHSAGAIDQGRGDYGFSSGANLSGWFYFSGISALTPAYWKLDWTITIEDLNPDSHSPSAAADITYVSSGDTTHETIFAQQLLGASRSLGGTLLGSTDSDFYLSTLMGFGSGNTFGTTEQSAGAFTFDVAITFSDAPFTTAPEPMSLGLLGLGLAGLGLAHRRR